MPKQFESVREKPLACTLLLGLEIADLSGPLAQFQATKPNHADMLHLVQTLNKSLGEAAIDEGQLKESFELCWPKLKEILDTPATDETQKHPERRPEEMLKELVELTRQTSLTVLESHRQLSAQIGEVVNIQASMSARLPSAMQLALSGIPPISMTSLYGLGNVRLETSKPGKSEGNEYVPPVSFNPLRPYVRPEDDTEQK